VFYEGKVNGKGKRAFV